MMLINNQPIVNVGDVYENMKNKAGNEVRYTTYFSILWNTLLEMFDYTGLPDTIPKRFLESILHSEGQVFISKINDDLIASTGTLSGNVDAYGLGTECIAVCPTGESRGKRNIDIAWGINNDSGLPDMLVYWISHLLGETDKSIKTNLVYSRLYKIPKLRDDKDKQAFEEMLNKIVDGNLKVFASKNVLDEELGAGTETFELTDANKIDKLPYLTQFFEDALKRFYNFYGQPMQNQNKRAQSISDEIHGMDSVSYILPIQMLKCRRELCDNINRIFGTDISVDFSASWKLEFNSLVLRDTNNNGIADVHENTGASGEDASGNTNDTSGDSDDSNTDQTAPPELTTSNEELTETIETLIDGSDSPAMSLESENPIDTTLTDENAEKGQNSSDKEERGDSE